MSRYSRSLKQLERAERVIPLGTQTFSKSRKIFPPGLAPLYVDRASNGRIWDVDGNEYVDLMSSLAAINLGHADPEIAEAVTKQLERGTTLSLTHPIEAEVAELIVQMVPCAEKVRFGKNGSDATTAAIRIARAHTSRDHVITLGYHGWQDWFIGSMPARNLGVPTAYSQLVHPVDYGDLTSLEQKLAEHPIAAVMLEPMTSTFPQPGYLQAVIDLAHSFGTLVVFDEMVTGFRFAPGGAQELFGVTPDLSTFGKGIANGFPLSAVVGKAELLDILENAFISGTFGGEVLSLAAAKVVLTRIQTTDVLSEVSSIGSELAKRATREIAQSGLSSFLSLSGHPTWKFLTWDSAIPDLEPLKYLFMQEMLKNGVLMIATHNVTAAHTPADINQVVEAYRRTLSTIKAAVANNNVSELLDADISSAGSGVRT